jgi:hypothetical protein
VKVGWLIIFYHRFVDITVFISHTSWWRTGLDRKVWHPPLQSKLPWKFTTPLVNTNNTADLMCAHLYDLFTCKTMDGCTHDIVLVSMLKPST